jgi:hypothetical protein
MVARERKAEERKMILWRRISAERGGVPVIGSYTYHADSGVIEVRGPLGRILRSPGDADHEHFAKALLIEIVVESSRLVTFDETIKF